MKKPATIQSIYKPIIEQVPVKHLLPEKDKAFLDLLADIFTKQIMKTNHLTLDKSTNK